MTNSEDRTENIHAFSHCVIVGLGYPGIQKRLLRCVANAASFGLGDFPDSLRVFLEPQERAMETFNFVTEISQRRNERGQGGRNSPRPESLWGVVKVLTMSQVLS